MSTVANVVVLFVALLHVYILVLEMFLWDKPRCRLTPRRNKRVMNEVPIQNVGACADQINR